MESQKRIYWVNMQQRTWVLLSSVLFKGSLSRRFFSPTMKPEQLIWFPDCNRSAHLRDELAGSSNSAWTAEAAPQKKQQKKRRGEPAQPPTRCWLSKRVHWQHQSWGFSISAPPGGCTATTNETGSHSRSSSFISIVVAFIVRLSQPVFIIEGQGFDFGRAFPILRRAKCTCLCLVARFGPFWTRSFLSCSDVRGNFDHQLAHIVDARLAKKMVGAIGEVFVFTRLLVDWLVCLVVPNLLDGFPWILVKGCRTWNGRTHSF